VERNSIPEISDGAFGTYRPKREPPRSAYVHIPFCRHRCGYCHFAVITHRNDLVPRYLNALQTELGWLDRAYELDTLFLGGGTPSYLDARQLEQIFKILLSRFSLTRVAETTVECNPTDLTADRCRAMADAGVNRISLGAQSLSDPKLLRLDRQHSADDVRQAVRAAKRFASSVSLDLIFAAPGESLAEWADDVERALELQPDHVSAYELTFEKGTLFWNKRFHGNLAETGEDLCAAMYCHAIDRLEQAGLQQYEVSSFARSNRRCRHNEIYWTGNSYFGFGPGAARLIDGRRETNHSSTTEYLKRVESGRSPVFFSEKLSAPEASAERLILGLRRTDGVDEVVFRQQTGQNPETILGRLTPLLLKNNLLVRDGGIWRLTRHGMMVSDEIASKILEQVEKKNQ
jgi:oxygen-independent coproporphyrinogen-3 oxidase